MATQNVISGLRRWLSWRLLGPCFLLMVPAQAESCTHLDTLPVGTPHFQNCGFGVIEYEDTFHAYGHDYYYVLVDRASGVVWLDFYLYVKDDVAGGWRLVLLRTKNKSNVRVLVEDFGLRGVGPSGKMVFFIAAESLK
ncbi:hypothetical protein [Leeia sp.]|uniref:hypothetical protein n=1 Tax=Leeia sp. TaxID=2884678 RepID=UPI0035AE28EC